MKTWVQLTVALLLFAAVVLFVLSHRYTIISSPALTIHGRATVYFLKLDRLTGQAQYLMPIAGALDDDLHLSRWQETFPPYIAEPAPVTKIPAPPPGFELDLQPVRTSR